MMSVRRFCTKSNQCKDLRAKFLILQRDVDSLRSEFNRELDKIAVEELKKMDLHNIEVHKEIKREMDLHKVQVQRQLELQRLEFHKMICFEESKSKTELQRIELGRLIQREEMNQIKIELQRMKLEMAQSKVSSPLISVRPPIDAETVLEKKVGVSFEDMVNRFVYVCLNYVSRFGIVGRLFIRIADVMDYLVRKTGGVKTVEKYSASSAAARIALALGWFAYRFLVPSVLVGLGSYKYVGHFLRTWGIIENDTLIQKVKVLEEIVADQDQVKKNKDK